MTENTATVTDWEDELRKEREAARQEWESHMAREVDAWMAHTETQAQNKLEMMAFLSTWCAAHRGDYPTGTELHIQATNAWNHSEECRAADQRDHAALQLYETVKREWMEHFHLHGGFIRAV